MSNRQLPLCKSLLTLLFSLALSSILILTVRAGAPAQSAEALSQVKNVFVGSFGADEAATRLREAMIKQLRKNGRLQVVSTPGAADAIIKGSGSIWVMGYVSADPRSPANAREADYRGFLSVEVLGKSNQPLWSYLVTPSKFRTSSITQDLANHAVAKLLEALDQQKEKSRVVPVAERSSQINLAGAGATFPAPLYEKWFESFQDRYPQRHIAYSAVGSDSGLQLLADNKVDFAASDAPLSDESEKLFGSQKPLVQFATVAGAVVPIYNLKGVERNIDFTPEALAEIYLGKIKNWNDPRMQAANKNIHLPSNAIAVIHRSDGSGTTFVWTDYLSKVSPEWKSAVGFGTVVHWPVGIGVEGNDAVAGLVQKTPNSIGYVELVYALRHQSSFGAVRNSAGEFVLADLESVTAAAKGAPGAITPDFRVSITNAPGKGAYPISTFTWWFFPLQLGGPDKKPVFLQLIQWMLTSGQNQCSSLGYVPLPREITTQELQALAKLQ
jgi:phosphate transport system substrate-binding protein